MHLTAITPILNVSDIAASIAWFERLGWSRCWTYNDGGPIENADDANQAGPAQFASVGSGECEIFLCLNGQGSRGGPLPRPTQGDDDTGGVWMTWWLRTPAEVDEVHERALRLGATVQCPPFDAPWNVREFHLVHPDGHTFRVSAPLHE